MAKSKRKWRISNKSNKRCQNLELTEIIINNVVQANLALVSVKAYARNNNSPEVSILNA